MPAPEAQPTIYGRVNLALAFDDLQSGSNSWDIESHASRLGFKGSLDLGENLEGEYQLEYQVDPSSSDATWKKRNSFVGIKGDWGRIRAGYFDTPLKRAQGGSDYLNDTAGDLKNVLNGDSRWENFVTFDRKHGDLVFTVGYSVGDNIDSARSSSVLWTPSKTFTLAVAEAEEEDGDKLLRIRTTLRFGDITLNAMTNTYERACPAQTNCESRDTGSLLSLGYKRGDWVLFTQYLTGDQRAAGSTALGLGATRKLSKNTKLIVYHNDRENDRDTGATTTAIGIQAKI